MTPDRLPRLKLGFLPTPVEQLDRLGAELDVRLSVKRDDFTGFGGGGNKVRKLEFLMAEAVEQGADTVITTGGHQSNHARMTAAAARKFGMRPVLVLRGHRSETLQGNLLLDHLLGAEIDFLDPDAYFTEMGSRMQHHADQAAARGGRAYMIPLGGASALGAMGYVVAMQELAGQLREAGLPAPDLLVAPVGSGGTLAGMHVGCALHLPHTSVLGIAVSGSAVPFPDRIAVMANNAAALLGLDRRWTPADIPVETGYVGPGYGMPSDAGNEAIRRAARTEGMLLDPVYTGKAMAGIAGCIADGTIPRGANVMFVHCGGSPALFPFAAALTADRAAAAAMAGPA